MSKKVHVKFLVGGLTAAFAVAVFVATLPDYPVMKNISVPDGYTEVFNMQTGKNTWRLGDQDFPMLTSNCQLRR